MQGFGRSQTITVCRYLMAMFFFLWLIYHVHGSREDCGDSIELRPKDPYVFIGERLILDCETNCSRNVSFSYGNDIQVLPEYQRHVSNNTHQLNMSINETFDLTIFYCIADETYLDRQSVKVEYPPRTVTNWTVVIYDWTTLNLTWDTGKYMRPGDVNITTMWSPNTDEWYSCSSHTNHSCHLNNIDYNNAPHYNFTISVTNKILGRSTKTTIPVVSADYVKPAPVNLMISNITSRNVTLKLRHFRFRRLEYRVLCWTSNLNKTTTEEELTIPNLEPNTEYEFWAWARSWMSDKGYWSDPVSIKNKTHEDVPTDGPNVTEGSFVAHACVENRRNVSVYLKPPDEENRNGNLTNYTAICTSDEGVRVTSYTYPRTYLTLWNLVCEKETKVSLTVSTSKGPSSPTNLTIPGSQHTHVRTSYIVGVLVGNDNTEVSWDFNPQCSSCLWTVYWCQVDGDRNCQENLDWEAVGSMPNSSIVSFTRNNTDDIKFAVSMVSSSKNSGMVWESCRVDLLKVTLALTLSGGRSVTWTMEECAVKTLIANYIIQHCHTDDTDCVMENVSREEREHSIGNLNDRVPYKLRIKLVAVSGGEGPFSDAVIVMPANVGPKTGPTIGVSILGVFVLGGAVLVLVTVIKYMRSRWAERENIDVPHGLMMSVTTKRTPEVCADSGRGSMNDTLHTLLPNGDQNSPPPLPKLERDTSMSRSDKDWSDYVRFHMFNGTSTPNPDEHSPMISMSDRQMQLMGEPCCRGEASGTCLDHKPEIQARSSFGWSEPWEPESGGDDDDDNDDDVRPYVTAGQCNTGDGDGDNDVPPFSL